MNMRIAKKVFKQRTERRHCYKKPTVWKAVLCLWRWNRNNPLRAAIKEVSKTDNSWTIRSSKDGGLLMAFDMSNVQKGTR